MKSTLKNKRLDPAPGVRMAPPMPPPLPLLRRGKHGYRVNCLSGCLAFPSLRKLILTAKTSLHIRQLLHQRSNLTTSTLILSMQISRKSRCITSLECTCCGGSARTAAFMLLNTHVRPRHGLSQNGYGFKFLTQMHDEASGISALLLMQHFCLNVVLELVFWEANLKRKKDHTGFNWVLLGH